MLTFRTVVDQLPEFDVLRDEANGEGYRFVERLVQEWQTGARFNRDGEALRAVYVDETLAAIGGITLDPVLPNTLRMRRFYVRPAFRGQNIGRQLVDALLAEHPGQVVVNAGRGSSGFWESVGFVLDVRDGHTHILQDRLAR